VGAGFPGVERWMSSGRQTPERPGTYAARVSAGRRSVPSGTGPDASVRKGQETWRRGRYPGFPMRAMDVNPYPAWSPFIVHHDLLFRLHPFAIHLPFTVCFHGLFSGRFMAGCISTVPALNRSSV